MSIYVIQLKDMKNAEKYCDRIYNRKMNDGRNHIHDNNNNHDDCYKNNNNVMDRNNDGTERDKERGTDPEGVYLFLLEIMMEFINKSTSSLSTSLSTFSSTSSMTDGSEEKNNFNKFKAENENKNENQSGNNEFTENSNTNIFIDYSDVIKIAEKYHHRINTQSFLSLVPPTLPLYMMEKYLRIVIEYESHKKRNLMVKFLFVFFHFHYLQLILF